MVRIPVTSADLDTGRIKSSISKLSKHHPDQSVKPKRSTVQHTFAQILGYGGYEELRSQAKKNGAIYSGQSLELDDVVTHISLRISRYWNVSIEKAESVAVALGLVHLDVFRPIPRSIQMPHLREVRVSPSERLVRVPLLQKSLFDAVRQATVMPMAQMELFRAGLEAMAHIAAIQEAMKPSAQMAAIYEAMKPSAQMAAIHEAMKPSAQMAAIYEAMKPSAQMAAIHEAMKPSAQMAAIHEALKPSAQMAAIHEALKPSAQMAAIHEAMKPSAQMAAIYESMKPLAQIAAIQNAINPMAHISAILASLKSKPN